MKPLRIAFVYNLKDCDIDLANPKTFIQADYDDQVTLEIIANTLKELEYEVLSLNADLDLFEKLRKNKDNIDLVFNYSVGVSGEDKYSNVSTFCEILGLSHTGPSPLSQALISNKERAKKIMVAYGIPTATFILFSSAEEVIKDGLIFPVMAKPYGTGSSAGMTGRCIATNLQELKEAVLYLLGVFNRPVLVENFLPGREFSVPMVGNPPQIFPIVELNHSILPKEFPRFASFEVKNSLTPDIAEKYLSCPAQISKDLKDKIHSICERIWDVFEIKDWCRIDIRCDENDSPFVLEINSPASLEPTGVVASYSSLPTSAKILGLSYKELIQEIISAALKRNSLV